MVVALLHVQPLCCPLPLLLSCLTEEDWATGDQGRSTWNSVIAERIYRKVTLFHVKICFLSFTYNQELTFTKSVNPWERSVKYTYTVRVYKHVVQGYVLAYKLNSKLSK